MKTAVSLLPAGQFRFFFSGSLVILFTHCVLALTAGFIPVDWYASQDPDLIFSAPSAEHWLGTDGLGRDVLFRTLLGGREILLVSLAATLLSVIFGVLAGMAAGYRGGWLDELIIRCVDLFRTVPWVLPALLIIAVVGRSPWVLIVVLGLFDGLDTIRVVRGATRSTVNCEYIISARVRGEKTSTVFYRELLPNIVHIVWVEAAMRYSWMLLRFSALSYMGFGASPPAPDWGLMISDSGPYISLAPWACLAPAMALTSLVLAVNLATNQYLSKD